MENIGEKIRKRRKELGLKVYELAEKVGVNPVYVTQIEKHNKLPSIEVFIKISHILKFTKSMNMFYLKFKYPKIGYLLI